MEDTAQATDREVLPAALRLFARSLPEQVALREVLAMIGPVEGQDCLEVCHRASGLSHHLRRHGGTWRTAALAGDEGGQAPVAAETVLEFDGHQLPFEDKTLDLIVVHDFLERIYADASFVAECHRLLRPTGRLAVVVPHLKRFSLLRPLSRLAGLSDARLGRVRTGYTEAHLFAVLKNGFDVHQVHAFSRVLVQFLDLVVVLLVGRNPGSDSRARERELRYRTVLYPLFWLMFQIDLVLVFSRGYKLAALAKRRAWRPRKAPVLVDGRSITEAVLSRIGG